MDIYLVRIRERHDGYLYVDRKPHATTSDDYIAISHVWGTPDTIQESTVEGVAWKVSLSPGKQDILSLLRRRDVCGKEWFWMDLFCIDQTDSPSISISDQLMAIPSIYKSSRCVKILIENPVCISWQEKAIQVFERGPVDKELFYEEELRHGRSCPHLFFADPWFERLWTRQEGLYATKLDFIVLKPAPCVRGRRQLPVAQWIAHGALLAQRSMAEIFLRDKLAYHGIQPDAAEEALFSIYFDVVYRHRVNILLVYDCKPGPDPAYNPIMEAWRSWRCTTKPRDYILAVFPDVDGYQVPPEARRGSFPELFLDAIQQPTIAARFQIAAKPIDKPPNIDVAYDTFTMETTNSTIGAQHFVVSTSIELEDINATPLSLEALRDDWALAADIDRHVTLVSLSGPCTGMTRQHDSDGTGLLRQHFSETFMHVAVSQFLPQEEMTKFSLRTNGVLSFNKIADIPAKTFALELKRFLVCLICGVSLPTADTVLEAADVVRVLTPHGTLLGVIHKGTGLTAKKNEFILPCSSLWDRQGFSIGLRVNGEVCIRGRTIIPNQNVWDSIKETLSRGRTCDIDDAISGT
ncbi:hypothetical protein GGR51DRAFT_577106 [Nemania sp. FL0031]|nr:hypothetical protein GGR51DRAFT_577106 [Nemania sp. FL0031]